MDGELNAWRRKHGISDDAFASLRNIIITSGSNTDSALTDVDQAALLAIEEWNNRLSSFSQVSQYEHMLPGDDGHTILGEPFEPGTAASFYQYEDPKTSHPVDNGAFRVPFFKIAGPTPYSISNDAYSEYQERDVVPELPSNWPSQDQLQSAYSHPTTNFVPNEAQYGLEPQATTHSAVSNAQAEVFRWEHPSANSIYIEPTDQKSRFVKIAPKPGSPVPEAPVKRSNRVQKTTTRSRNGLRPCIRCWLRKRECSGAPEDCCNTCLAGSLPKHLCMRVRFADVGVFQKWQDTQYQSTLQWQNLLWKPIWKAVTLQHETGGPTLDALCQEFHPVSMDQMQIFWKDTTGWRALPTTAYGLAASEIDLGPYISAYIDFYLDQPKDTHDFTANVLEMVRPHKEKSLLNLSLKLWAATKLLNQDWKLAGPETLGMRPVDQPASPLWGKIPVPRVVQNQLDRSIEAFVFATECELLKHLQSAMLKKTRAEWLDVFLAVIVILHVHERDTWRLMFWINHDDELYKWRHPSKPADLIARSIHFSNILLAHTRLAGDVPEEFGAEVKRYRQQQRRNKINRNLKLIYQERLESSLDASLSSLVLDDSADFFAKTVDFTTPRAWG